ncbi:MAG: DNA-binding response regulator [Spirochaetes bacterium GWB1_59_5]|nr:MAG: DNA-binding response regulator [Spirochaetes bacterium GWB1_59_5]
MKARVLIIEDVAELSDLVALYLSKEGMETRQAESGEDALAMLGATSAGAASVGAADPANAFVPDIVILDINLPGMDGFEFLHEFRKSGGCPVLIVSARDADEDIIAGLGYGADEFVTKPFSPRVLVARVRAMLRRVQDAPAPGDGSVIRFGPYTIDLDSCVLKRGNERVALSAKEYAVLSFLITNSGKPLGPEALYAGVWKNAYGDMTTVAVYIQRLRKKIETDPAAPRYIETVYGMGYRFTLDPEPEP